MRFLLHDGESLGYDFRDFEAVLEFARDHADDTLFIYTRATNIELFTSALSAERATYIGYSKHDSLRLSPALLAQRLGVAEGSSFAFGDLHALAARKPKLPSGQIVPSGDGYLDPPTPMVEHYQGRLNAIARATAAERVVFAVVSGLKPLSDVGENASQRLEEGRRQTYPLESVAGVAAHLQGAFAASGIAVVPLCVQYGNRVDVLSQVNAIQHAKPLRHPLQVVEDVDWNELPLQQAAFYLALKRFGSAHRLPVLAFGNASTYLHLILAAAGGFDAMAVALHGYPVVHRRDGRPYWDELGACLSSLRTFRQQTAGDWTHVSASIARYLESAIARAFSTPQQVAVALGERTSQ